MKMPSSSAQDRQVQVWFQRIQNGEIKLPRFQRHQAWDKKPHLQLVRYGNQKFTARSYAPAKC